MSRDDFSAGTIRVLASRVSQRCSNPGCRAPTSGPHTDPTKTTLVGVAAHISAASEGGPRYDANLTPEQRRSIGNGIWLCETCAAQIDKDPAAFSVATLREWKRSAEAEAATNLGKTQVPILPTAPWTPQSGISPDYESVALSTLAKHLNTVTREKIEALLEQAREHLARGQFDQAFRDYTSLNDDEALSALPDLRFKVLNNLSLAARHRGDRGAALKASQSAIELEPDNRLGHITHLGNLGAFRDPSWPTELEANRAWLTEESAGLQFLALREMDQGKYIQALELSEKAIELDSKNHAARFNAATCLYRLANRDRAQERLLEIPANAIEYIAAQVMLAELSYQRARSHADQSRVLERAWQHLERAQSIATTRELEPSDWSEARKHWIVCRAGLMMLRQSAADAVQLLEVEEEQLDNRLYYCLNIGQAYAATGETEKAQAMFEEAYRLDPENVETGHWLGATHLHLFWKTGERSHLDSAESTFRKLWGERDSTLALLNLVQIMIGSGRVGQAAVLVIRAKAKRPHDLEVKVAELQVLRAQGNTASADEKADEIYRQDPFEVTAATYLGVNDYRANRREQALVKLENAVADRFSSSSVHVESYEFLARTLVREARREEALTRALEGSRRYPDQPRLKELCEELAGKGDPA